MNRINPNHQQERGFLRIIGPIVLIIGIIFAIIGFGSFFSSFGSFEPPKYFWCAFIGLPMSGVGLAICNFAFMGKVARYTAGELAPVGKDTFNYLAKETKPGVKDISEAFFSGKESSDTLDIASRLKKLDELKQSGLIDEDDFEDQKDRILSEI